MRRTSGPFVSLIVCLAGLAGLFPAHALELDIVSGRIYGTMAANTTVQDDLYNMGIRAVRMEFEEYANPATTVAQYQKIIGDLNARGITVLGVLTSNSCSDHTNAPWTNAYITNYYTAFRQHVANYPSVKYWEIWNEPENYGFAGHLDGYGLLLKRTFESARADRNNGVIPADIKIVSGGTDNQDINVMHAIYDTQPVNDFRAVNGGDIPCDIFAYHPYGNQAAGNYPDPYTTAFSWGETFAQSFNDLQNWKTNNGLYYLLPQSKPVWMTEWGFDSALVGVENQRIYTEHMIYAMAAFPRIEKAFHYTYNDNPGDGRGLRTAVTGGACKRAYYPYQAHASLTGLYTPDGTNEWTLDEFIQCFQRNGGRNAVGMPYKAPGSPWYGDKAHAWSDGTVQNFSGGAWGTSSAILESPRNVGNAFWVHAGFWDRYLSLGGPYSYLEFPTTDEYGYGAGTRQDFEGGYMTWDPTNGVRNF
jgi:hypothetical protein